MCVWYNIYDQIQYFRLFVYKEGVRMICPKCSKELTEVYAFCPECGFAFPSAEQIAVETAEAKEAETIVPIMAPESSTDLDASKPIQPMEEPVIFEPASSAFVNPDWNSSAVATEAVSSTSVIPPVKTAPVLSKENKPLKTVGTFFYLILSCIPVIGFIVLMIVAFGGKNKSRKSLSRALLILGLIAFLAVCAEVVVLYIFNREVFTNMYDVQKWTDTMDFFVETFFVY